MIDASPFAPWNKHGVSQVVAQVAKKIVLHCANARKSPAGNDPPEELSHLYEIRKIA